MLTALPPSVKMETEPGLSVSCATGVWSQHSREHRTGATWGISSLSQVSPGSLGWFSPDGEIAQSCHSSSLILFFFFFDHTTWLAES